MTSDAVALGDLERRVVRAAMLEWGGTARPTDELATAMGFASSAHMPGETLRLWQSIDAGELLAADDWRRVLLAVEIAFASDIFGVGVEWETTSGVSDSDTLTALRSLQRSVARMAR